MKKVFLLLLLTACMLVPLRWVPAMTIGGYEVKPVDMLSDVWKGGSGDVAALDTSALSSLTPQLSAKQALRDSCPAGTVPIVDYADETCRGMAPFYAALSRRATLERPVRIAYFGDSFIESDILTADLRRLLQTTYGGEGVGFVDMDSPYASNRTSVQQRAAGWTALSVLDKGKFVARELGINQRYFHSSAAAWTELRGVRQPALGAFSQATLYLTAAAPLTVTATLGAATQQQLTAEGTGRVEALTAAGRTSNVRFAVPRGATCYGIALEGKSGLSLDCFSLRGSAGTTLLAIPEENLRAFNDVRPYDLIVLQYGLNVVQKNTLKYTSYVDQMRKVVQHIKRAFPEAGILIVSVGDREDKLADGRLHTMPGIKALLRHQEALAAHEHVAFYNLFDAMGGEGSIKRMAEAKPAEAARDYTHISHRGGQRIAEQMFKSFKWGFECYKKWHDE